MYVLIEMLIRGDVDTTRVFGPFDSEDAARSLAQHHGWTRDDYRIRHLEGVEGFTMSEAARIEGWSQIWPGKDAATTLEP